jgi:nucleotide-binding universal stress UspA family protein
MKPPPFASLVCATDFSALGDAAAAVAFALAGKDATVHLVHVNAPALVVSPLDGTPLTVVGGSPEESAAAEARAEKHLQGLVPPDAGARGIRTRTHVLVESDVAATLHRVARDVRADVLVVGTHGRSGLDRLLMGSVATDVLRHAGPPVIVVRGPKR